MIKSFIQLSFILILSGCWNSPHDPTPGQIISHEKLKSGHKICIIGDSGKNNSHQKIVAKNLLQEECHQIRHTGDVIYNDGLDSAQDPEFFNRFYQYYSPLIDQSIPFFITLGNHDYKKNPSAWLQIAQDYSEIKFPSLYYMDIYDDVCFISFDTNSNYINQYKWTKKIKNLYRHQCKVFFGFGHHPLYSSGKHGNAKLQFKRFLKTTIESHLDAYFAGHDHHLEDYGKIKGTHYMISGSAGEYRYIKSPPRRWAEAKLGYIILVLNYDQNMHPQFDYSFFIIDEKTGQKQLQHTGRI